MMVRDTRETIRWMFGINRCWLRIGGLKREKKARLPMKVYQDLTAGALNGSGEAQVDMKMRCRMLVNSRSW